MNVFHRIARIGVAAEFSQELGLPGSYAPGSYTLRVNGVTKHFTVS